jgi:hypothetical protein
MPAIFFTESIVSISSSVLSSRILTIRGKRKANPDLCQGES